MSLPVGMDSVSPLRRGATAAQTAPTREEVNHNKSGSVSPWRRDRGVCCLSLNVKKNIFKMGVGRILKSN